MDRPNDNPNSIYCRTGELQGPSPEPAFFKEVRKISQEDLLPDTDWDRRDDSKFGLRHLEELDSAALLRDVSTTDNPTPAKSSSWELPTIEEDTQSEPGPAKSPGDGVKAGQKNDDQYLKVLRFDENVMIVPDNSPIAGLPKNQYACNFLGFR